MKVIIAGSRLFVPTHSDALVLDKYKNSITEVVSGCAKGGDAFGESWAAWNNVKIKKFPANWDLYGKAAGHIRNKEMALYADGLIAFMVNNSKGTSNMIKQAKEHNLWVEIVEK